MNTLHIPTHTNVQAAAPHAVLIGNDWLRGEGPALPVTNPVTESVLTSVPSASATQVDAAVSSAAAAFHDWSRTTPGQRGTLLRRIANGIEAQRSQLQTLQMCNSGKPAYEAALDVSDAIATFTYYADRCDAGTGLLPEAVPVPDDGFHATLERVPVGVVGLIVPWNFPMVTTAWKLAPALAAGCTVVLKPSELTPLAEIALLEVIRNAGLPPGVVNAVCGGAEVGQALVSHRLISKISFTGSNATGQKILQSCGPRMQRLSLELGGKSALLVLDDADIGKAIELAMAGAFFNAGQMCSATSRICVARPLYADFVSGFVAAAQALKPGAPEASDTTLGPLISQRQRDNVLARIHAGLADGAQLLTGGNAPSDRSGYFVQPTVFSHAAHSRPLWEEEIFGPVACIEPIDSDAHAVATANESPFGLVATIVAGDSERAHTVARGLQVGTVWINAPQLIFPQTGWGGFKHSGLGRELGPWGLQAFQELRHTVAAGIR
jgi:betaine-aldehyde dehydrogenase